MNRLRLTMKNYIHKLLFIGIIILLAGCKKDDFKPEENYIKIYNDSEGNKNYVPLSIQQTGDQGYLMLSAYDGWNIHIMKTDKNGEFVWKASVPSNYVNAASNLIRHNGYLYFVCMDKVGLFTYLVQVDEHSGALNEIQKFTGILYPTAAYSDGNSIYIQSYNRLSYETGIHKLNTALTGVALSGKVNIFTDVESKIVSHINYSGKRMPFFISSSPENDYVIMSGFYNYSFSLIFMNANLQFTGVYNGANFNGSVNAILPHGGSAFSVARYSYDNLYFNPNTTLNPTSIDIAESISAQGFSELNPEKPVIIRKVKADNKEYVALVASTRSNQILISFFDPSSGALKGKKYVGKNIPYTACDISATIDGGLMLLVQAKIMGSYNRIATIKLSDEQLAELAE
jgi:hypothetical protein